MTTNDLGWRIAILEEQLDRTRSSKEAAELRADIARLQKQLPTQPTPSKANNKAPTAKKEKAQAPQLPLFAAPELSPTDQYIWEGFRNGGSEGANRACDDLDNNRLAA